MSDYLCFGGVHSESDSRTLLWVVGRDIDLVIVSPSMEKQNKVSVLHTLAAVLRRANLAENIQVISKAKVPIVKFISSYGPFCSLSNQYPRLRD